VRHNRFVVVVKTFHLYRKPGVISVADWQLKPGLLSVGHSVACPAHLRDIRLPVLCMPHCPAAMTFCDSLGLLQVDLPSHCSFSFPPSSIGYYYLFSLFFILFVEDFQVRAGVYRLDCKSHTVHSLFADGSL
jgi:hypothetical protein